MSIPHSNAITYLRTLPAVRERSQLIYNHVKAGRSPYFAIDGDRIDDVATYVIQVMRDTYNETDAQKLATKISLHSRWRHFESGDPNRPAQLRKIWQKKGCDPIEIARREIDLVVISVLLDAGAGTAWSYREAETGLQLSRSEGLAIASLSMFAKGYFSSTHDHPFQVDAEKLLKISPETITHGFQVSPQNPMVGIDGRINLLRNLGRSLIGHPDFFGASRVSTSRPGHLIDYLLADRSRSNTIPISRLWTAIITGLEHTWPTKGRLSIENTPLGDVWHHTAIQAHPPLVPFHKLSQWLVYSLVEPIERLGLTITGIDQMTGLPEYRNGGLLVDMGVLVPKSSTLTENRYSVDSEIIVEWRALTVVLIDQIADAIRRQLSVSHHALPLIKILEGGTWRAGRRIAEKYRADGTPPIQVDTDGTVF